MPHATLCIISFWHVQVYHTYTEGVDTLITQQWSRNTWYEVYWPASPCLTEVFLPPVLERVDEGAVPCGVPGGAAPHARRVLHHGTILALDPCLPPLPLEEDHHVMLCWAVPTLLLQLRQRLGLEAAPVDQHRGEAAVLDRGLAVALAQHPLLGEQRGAEAAVGRHGGQDGEDLDGGTLLLAAPTHALTRRPPLGGRRVGHEGVLRQRAET